MNVRQGRTAFAAVLVSALALVAAACGGNDSSGGGGGGGNAKPTQQQEQAANKAIDIKETPVDQVKQGGTIRWAVDQFSTQWNYNQLNGPNVATSRVLYGVMPYAFISDSTAKSFPNKDYVTDAKVTQSPKQTVTITLNPKAKWSDGTPITEKDYEAQWKALNGKQSAYQVSSSTGYDQIESVKQGKDEYEVVATFSQPFADWMSLWSPLYPAEYNSSPDKFNKGYLNKVPVTAGPFKVDKIDSTAKTVSMVPDPNWWGAKPKLDRIITRALETDAAVNAFVNGEVDINEITVDASAYKRVSSVKGSEVRVAGGPDFRHITINGTSPNLSDLNVRKAVAMSINRQAIAKADLTGLPWPARTMDNHLFVNTQGGYKPEAGEVGKFDPEKAKQMLDQAGWKQSGTYRQKGGKTLDLRFVIPTGIQVSRQEGELTQAMLRDVGIKLDIRPVPSDDFFDKYIIPGNFDLVPFSWIGTPFPISSSASIYANPTKDDKGELQIQQNFARVGSKQIDDLMDKAGQELDPAKARDLANQADALIWNEVHSLVLYQRPQQTAVKSNLVNVGSFGFQQPDYTKMGFAGNPS